MDVRTLTGCPQLQRVQRRRRCEPLDEHPRHFNAISIHVELVEIRACIPLLHPNDMEEVVGPIHSNRVSRSIDLRLTRLLWIGPTTSSMSLG